MTSYKYIAVRDDDPYKVDRNQNITKQPEVFDIGQTNYSDDEDWEQKSSGFRGRSQSLKHLNERVETGSISRSKSLRDVDTGDFSSVKARVSYVDSWNPVNPVGRGKIAERVKSWENNLDAEEDGWRRRKSPDYGMDRRNLSSSSYNGTRAQNYDSYHGSASRDWREERDESHQSYSQETTQYAYDNYRDPERDQVR